MKWACVRVPSIELQAWSIRDTSARLRPAALVDVEGVRGRVVALNRAARQEGIRRGMTRGGALALCAPRQSLPS